MTLQHAAQWAPKKLHELGFVGRGRSRHRPRNDASLYGGVYPFFQTGDVKSAEFYLHEYSQTYNEKGLAQSKLWEPGTLCITIAANIADSAIMSIPGCFPDSIVGFVAEPEVTDVRFVKYYIDTLKHRMEQASKGTTQDNLSLDKLLTFDILVPPLSVQKEIANILSAYDDLIENNTRRIAILEEMARNLYREWFVELRFPGHEQVAMVESELGLIPEGWEVRRLDDAIVLQRGFDLPLKQRKPGPIVVYAATGPIGTHNEAKVRGPGVLTGRSGSLGTVMYVHDDFWPLNTTLWIKEFRHGSPIWAFHLLRGLGLEGFNSGAAVPTLNRNDIHGLPIVAPRDDILSAFDAHASVIHSEMRILEKKSLNLRQTRDLLLPKLISGEIDVNSVHDEVVRQ